MEEIGSREVLDRLVATGACLLVNIADPAEPASVAFSEAVRQVRDQLPGVRCARLSLSGAPEVAALFGVERAPAMLLFRAGVGLFAGPAPLDAARLEALVKRALALDMDQVRREMDRERAALGASVAFRACPTSKRGPLPAG